MLLLFFLSEIGETVGAFPTVKSFKKGWLSTKVSPMSEGNMTKKDGFKNLLDTDATFSEARF
jgi:hypothetical protein